MKRLIASLSALLFSAGASAVDRWSFGPFSMDALAGFSYKEGRSPAIYTDPDGAAALITVHVLNGRPTSDQAQQLVARARDSAKSTFEKGAAKYGKTNAEFSVIELPSGDSLAALPVVTNDAGGEGYLLQFAVISKLGNLAIITIEGRGAAQNATTRFMSAIRSARFAT